MTQNGHTDFVQPFLGYPTWAGLPTDIGRPESHFDLCLWPDLQQYELKVDLNQTFFTWFDKKLTILGCCKLTCLAHAACLLHGLYVLLVFIYFFLFLMILWRSIISESAGPSIVNFDQMVGIWSQIIHLGSFSESVDVANATNLRGKVGLFTFIRCFHILKCNADWCVNSGNDLAMSYENLMNYMVQ